jgi:hypothetical protein
LEGSVNGADGSRNFDSRFFAIEDRSESLLALDEKFARAFARDTLGEKRLLYAVISDRGGGDI